jgi:hypothetical protein
LRFAADGKRSVKFESTFAHVLKGAATTRKWKHLLAEASFDLGLAWRAAQFNEACDAQFCFTSSCARGGEYLEKLYSSAAVYSSIHVAVPFSFCDPRVCVCEGRRIPASFNKILLARPEEVPES